MNALLNEKNEHEDLTALSALKIAFEWCLETMTPEKLMQQRRPHILKSVFQLDDALQIGEELLNAVFAPNVLSKAKLGKTVKDALQEKQEEIKSLRKDLSTVKREVKKLTQREEQAQKIVDDHTELQQHYQELEADIERLSQFTEGDVAQLRKQFEALQQRIPPQGQEIEQFEQQIQQSGEQFLLLTDTLLSQLSEKAKNAMQRADARKNELQETVKQIQDAQERYQAAEEQLTERKKILELYQNADREIAGALPNAEAANDLLDEVERLLHSTDQILKDVMEANSKARKLSEIGY